MTQEKKILINHNLDTNKEILSKIIHFSKYARHIDNLKRRETYEETVDRYLSMHKNKFPQYEKEIDYYGKLIYDKCVVPSMRGLQFGGMAIEKNNARLYNCSGLAVNKPEIFSTIMFLLLCGTGVGFSVQRRHVDRLPRINKSKQTEVFWIEDSIEGWADSVGAIMKWAFGVGDKPSFDYSAIRPKGSPLKTSGGIAPGPDALKACNDRVIEIIESMPDGSLLTPLLCHDIICIFATAVMSGGIRRSACISLFDKDDEEMLQCKTTYPIVDWQIVSPLKSGFVGIDVEYVESDSYGREELRKVLYLSSDEFESMKNTMELPWYYFHSQRSQANNSVVLLRRNTRKEDFDFAFDILKKSEYGEPGFYFTNNLDALTNPCGEISFSPGVLGANILQFCNLTEIDISKAVDAKDLLLFAEAASFFGTLQATYTDFHYIPDFAKINTEHEALLGISLTGIASKPDLDLYELENAASHAVEVNNQWASRIGINPAARVTCVKPSGTASLLLGTSSGVHSWHDNFYVRRIRINKSEAIHSYLKENFSALLEDEYFNPSNISVFSIPIKAPDNACIRAEESAIKMLNRVKYLHDNWIKPGHVSGVNSHNVSVTVAVRPSEWEGVREWMWDNRRDYNAISLLNFDPSSYKQPPFESITEEAYEELSQHLVGKEFDLSKVIESRDHTERQNELACAGGACDLVI